MVKEIVIDIKEVKKLTNKEKNFINNLRRREFGKEYEKDFKKAYTPDTKFFFLKHKNKIVAITGIIPINIEYENKKYKIAGLCSGISAIKNKGYGRIIIASIISYLKTNGLTGIGFTGQRSFYEIAGLKGKKNFIRRFVYLNKKTGEKIIDRDGDAVYFEGKDKLITKMSKNKKIAYCDRIHW